MLGAFRPSSQSVSSKGSKLLVKILSVRNNDSTNAVFRITSYRTTGNGFYGSVFAHLGYHKGTIQNIKKDIISVDGINGLELYYKIFDDGVDFYAYNNIENYTTINVFSFTNKNLSIEASDEDISNLTQISLV